MKITKNHICKYKCRIPSTEKEVFSGFSYFSYSCGTTHTETTDTESSLPVVSFSIPVSVKILKSDLSYKNAKALAFAALVRAHEQNNNKRCSYTINKLHILTGIHSKTILVYLARLEDMGFISYDENKKIVIRSIRSRHKGMSLYANITIGTGKDLKNAEKALLALRLQNRVRQINFYRDAITRFHEIKNRKKTKRGDLAEFKKINRWLKLHCKTDFRNKNFENFGWSYNNIAEYLHVSVKQAVNLVSFACQNNYLTKKKNSIKVKFSHVSQLDFIPHTFIAHGIAFRIHANSYDLGTGII